MIRDGKPGRRLQRGDAGFDVALLGTSFNGRDPGRRPQVIVQANTVDDVIAAVNEARASGLRVSLCSGGHSWAQNHLRDDALLIDLSRLNAIAIDAGARTASIGPGCEGAALNRALAKQKLFFPTPHAPDVAMGGFLLQGGFGWGSRALGLACESVTAVDVVLADGTLVHADATHHPDLYWAARGAGPGFFGVVVCFYLRLYPRPRAIGLVLQVFPMAELERVFRWADDVGPQIAREVEFQMLMTPKTFGGGGPGIEIAAPVLATSIGAAREATRFLRESPIRRKARLALPWLPMSLDMMQKTAARTHFPDGMRWSVDNMWTDAPIDALLPGLETIGATLPPSPSHVLWLDWRPPATRPDMAFSVEASRYLALYGEWRDPALDAVHLDWATQRMQEMAPLSAGIQLADENLGRRAARFLSAENFARLAAIRARYDRDGLFNSWMASLEGESRRSAG